jgi:hypothetical protein
MFVLDYMYLFNTHVIELHVCKMTALLSVLYIFITMLYLTRNKFNAHTSTVCWQVNL